MRIFLKIWSIIICVFIFLSSCKQDDNGAEMVNEGLKIALHFYQNDKETQAEFESGMQWGFSFLGANLPKGSWEVATTWSTNQDFELDIKQLGFTENALTQFRILIAKYKESEEYKVTARIDAGRFMTSVLNNSNHYYKIVGVPRTLSEYNSSNSFLTKRAAIIESAVAVKERKISLPSSANSITSLSYLAEELSGSLKDSSNQTEEFETIDVMANGQLRFAIYSKNGALINGADPNLSVAGKPIKCLWCHETNIQTGFAALTKIPGYFTPREFDSIVGVGVNTLNNYRAGLSPEVNFLNNSLHAEIEKIYIRFMEPSAKRLAAEWSISEAEVKTKLSNLSTHLNGEFPEMGQLYFRMEVEANSPYQVLPSIKNARETELNEPNLLP